jgi:hypothetical protein
VKRPFPLVTLSCKRRVPATVGFAARFKLDNGSEMLLTATSAERLKQACERFGLRVGSSPLNVCGIESATRLLIHARNNRGALRSTIRAAIHADILVLRKLQHG